MALSATITAIQKCISNPLSASVFGDGYIAGIIGDAPSHYSRSPGLWNAAFQHTGIDAVYLPFDVNAVRIGELLSILKNYDRFLGLNVTVPHKVTVMDFLEDLDPNAQRIQAVNTVVRASDGRLVGCNTDGEGFIQSLITPQPDRAESFVGSLSEMDVLLLGAGGSARAVAFHVADAIGDGRLLVCNRTIAQAQSLADAVSKGGGKAKAILEAELLNYAATVGLIVNSTTKGQGGMRKVGQDRVTLLQPYSALAPADPPSFPESESANADFESQWSKAANDDLEANHRASMQLAESVPLGTRFYDLIYHPEETVFLRHGRLTGHPTMNGKSMIVNQAVLAFERVCGRELAARGSDTPEMYRELVDVMYRSW